MVARTPLAAVREAARPEASGPQRALLAGVVPESGHAG